MEPLHTNFFVEGEDYEHYGVIMQILKNRLSCLSVENTEQY